MSIKIGMNMLLWGIETTPAKIPIFEALAEAGSEIVVEKTGGAVEHYNRFVEDGRDVAAALHVTC